MPRRKTLLTEQELQEFVHLLTSDTVTGDVVPPLRLRQGLVKYPGSVKYRFKVLATWVLQTLADQLGLGDFRIWFNPAGPAVGGEARLASDKIYVMLSPGAPGVLYRRSVRKTDPPRRGKRDPEPVYESAQFGNQWLPFSDLLELPKLAAHLRKFTEIVDST